MQFCMKSRGRAMVCVATCLAVVASIAIAAPPQQTQQANVLTVLEKGTSTSAAPVARPIGPIMMESPAGRPEGPGVCGDGVVDPTEDCDPTAAPPGDTCTDGSACDPITCVCGTCDNCPSAPACPIFEGVPVNGTTVGNTASDGGETGICLDNSLMIDAYYEYNPTCTGIATMTSTCTSGNACLNMVHGFVAPDACNALVACDDTGTALSWNVFLGDVYHLRVGDTTGIESGYTVSVTCAPSVCNNGVLEPGEDCDPSATAPDNLCVDGSACPVDCDCGGCPASSITVCNGTVTQSTSKDTALGAVSISCGGGLADQNWARCFDDGVEGWGVNDIEVTSVTLEVGASGDGTTVCAQIYEIASCATVESEPTGSSMTPICTECITTNAIDEDTLVTITFPNPPVIPAGSDMVVEIHNPVGTFVVEQNTAPSCGPSYIRADTASANCGIANWTPLANIGFPDSALVINAEIACYAGTIPVCGNGTREGCEECDTLNTECGGGATSCVDCVCINPPDNDDCANAEPIACCGAPFSTISASTDGVTHVAGSCNSVSQTVDNDVWYSHTATCTGTLTVSTCNDADYDSKLAVYTDNGTCPPGDAELLGCNDTAGGCGLTAEVASLAVTAGDALLIRVGGSGPGITGTGNLTITCDMGNDACAAALSVTDGVTPFSTCGATTDGPPVVAPCLDPSAGKHDIWFDYVATCTSANALISLCSPAGDSYDSTLEVYDGAGCAPTGLQAACGDDDCGFGGGMSEVQMALVLGQTYKIRVGSWDPETGAKVAGCGELLIDCGFVPCGDPASGDCCDPLGTGSRSCDNAACCNAVCAIDPFCCDVEWDGFCAGTAATECLACQPGVPIPTVSEWGLWIMTLLLATAGTVVFARRRLTAKA